MGFLNDLFGGGGNGERRSRSTATTSAPTAASDGSIAVGQSGKYLESGGVDLSGSAEARLGTTELSAGRDVSIETADPELLTAALEEYGQLGQTALETYGELSRSNTSAFSSFAKQRHEQQAEDLATLLAGLGQLQEDTDEEAQQKKFTLYVVLAVLTLLGLLGWFYSRRK